MTKGQLEDRLYDRMYAENKAFLREIRAKPVDEIISHAHEIARREDILLLFQDETNLDQRQLAVLLEFEHPLSVLYNDWVSRDTGEMEQLERTIVSCADDILNERAEKKYRDPAQPMYGKSWKEACACGEAPEWMADHRRSMECARAFQVDGELAFHEETFTPFLKKWEMTFGRERCLFVLACTIQLRDGRDGVVRFSPSARQTAAKFQTRMERIGNHIDDYAVAGHSCIVNTAVEYLARPERSKEKASAQRRRSQHER